MGIGGYWDKIYAVINSNINLGFNFLNDFLDGHLDTVFFALYEKFSDRLNG